MTFGATRVMTTVVGSGASMLAMPAAGSPVSSSRDWSRKEAPSGSLTLMARSRLYFTSSLSKSLPSWNFTPSRRVKV